MQGVCMTLTFVKCLQFMYNMYNTTDYADVGQSRLLYYMIVHVPEHFQVEKKEMSTISTYIYYKQTDYLGLIQIWQK